MTAVATPPTFPQHHRPAWGSIDANTPMDSEDVRPVFVPRKTLARTNSNSSISSTASTNSDSTVLSNVSSQPNGTTASTNSDLSSWSGSRSVRGGNSDLRKRPILRPPPKSQPQPTWSAAGQGDVQPDFSRIQQPLPNGMVATHGSNQPQPVPKMGQGQGMMVRPSMSADQLPSGQPVLYLLSLNGTFERKTIAVPLSPESLRIGRQTNQKTVPTPTNGFFDSKVLSRQHAEIYAERNGKIFIRDIKSSNGTFVNGTRLSQENRESEPHELQTGDHLELGIDIVSEDQKTVVHHKVAAKVEHAGMMSSSNNVLDMNFGDLDPANSSIIMPNGGMQMRGRAGSNSSAAGSGRMMQNPGMIHAHPGAMAQQRPFFLSPIATDQILKRLATEMRSARLQAQDLGRTNQFVHTLLSKNDVKDLEKPEIPEPAKPQQLVNGSGVPFRTDPKTRFSEPPAPPPQQPLPEKPDVPSLKRGPTERPKSGPPNTSPVRQENMAQIVQLTEALNNAKRDFDSQTARMRELETMLQKEREARELAEELAKRLEESATIQQNGSAIQSIAEEVCKLTVDDDVQSDVETVVEPDNTSAEIDAAKETAVLLQSRIDTMDDQMRELRGQMEQWKNRCEVAESERDADRKTLEEMVIQLRAEDARRASRERRSRSRARHAEQDEKEKRSYSSSKETPVPQADGSNETSDSPTLSRANTIMPATTTKAPVAQGLHLQAGLPYASGLVVVLLGMGLMAYINGSQNSPPRFEQ